MTKEEYIKKNNEDIDNMSIEDLRAYTKRIDANAQVYFKNWQNAESQLKEHSLKNESKLRVSMQKRIEELESQLNKSCQMIMDLREENANIVNDHLELKNQLEKYKLQLG